jgi:hypothetical protein
MPVPKRLLLDTDIVIALVPKLRLGNQVSEALASRNWKLELP